MPSRCEGHWLGVIEVVTQHSWGRAADWGKLLWSHMIYFLSSPGYGIFVCQPHGFPLPWAYGQEPIYTVKDLELRIWLLSTRSVRLASICTLPTESKLICLTGDTPQVASEIPQGTPFQNSFGKLSRPRMLWGLKCFSSSSVFKTLPAKLQLGPVIGLPMVWIFPPMSFVATKESTVWKQYKSWLWYFIIPIRMVMEPRAEKSLMLPCFPCSFTASLDTSSGTVR